LSECGLINLNDKSHIPRRLIGNWPDCSAKVRNLSFMRRCFPNCEQTARPYYSVLIFPTTYPKTSRRQT